MNDVIDYVLFSGGGRRGGRRPGGMFMEEPYHKRNVLTAPLYHWSQAFETTFLNIVIFYWKLELTPSKKKKWEG